MGTNRTIERQVAMILDRYIRGKDGFGVERLSIIAVVPRCTIHNHCAQTANASMAHVLTYVSAIATEEPARALAMWRELSELVAMEARPAPHRTAPVAVLAAGIGFEAEVGDVARALANATAPGSPGGMEILAEEIPAILPEVREAVIAGEMMEAAARGVPSAQMRLAAVHP